MHLFFNFGSGWLPHPVNWSPSHSTGPQTPFLTDISVTVQSGRCSRAKHGDAYFSAMCGSIQDPIAALGLYENQER